MVNPINRKGKSIMDNETTLSIIENRLKNLEISNRRLKIILAVIAGLLLTVLATGAGTIGAGYIETIKTQHIEVVDEDGMKVIEMLDDGIFGPMIRMYSSEGELAIELDADSAGYGGAARFYGLDGRSIMKVGAIRGWGPGFVVCDDEGQSRVELKTLGSGATWLSFVEDGDDETIPIMKIGISHDGEPMVEIYGDEGVERYGFMELLE